MKASIFSGMALMPQKAPYMAISVTVCHDVMNELEIFKREYPIAIKTLSGQ